MTQLTINAADLARIVKAVERSAAKDDARPVLAGVHLAVAGNRLTATAADGFRLSQAHATLDESAPAPVAAILERAGLLAFAKSLKPKTAPLATIDTDSWTFAANGTRATVRQIAGTYPDVAPIIGSGDEPVLFAVNPQYFRDTLASHGSNVVTISRAKNDPSAPLFFTAEDGTRHVVMPMIKPASVEWKRREDAGTVAAPVVEVAPEVEPEPAPVTPEESAFRTQRAANERRLAKRAERRAAAAAGSSPQSPGVPFAHDAPTCATCDTRAEPADNFCAECGTPFGEPAPVAITRAPVATPYALAAYSAKNRERILAQCPGATDVRGFHAWLKAGRVVRKGQKGIKIVAPVMGGDGNANVVNIKPAYVFDVTQTQERPHRAAA